MQAEKRCPRCKTVKHTSDFYVSKSRGGGDFFAHCKACVLQDRAKKAKHRIRNYPVSVSEAKCIGCGLTKPAGEFQRNASRKTGLSARCAPCRTIEDRRKQYGLTVPIEDIIAQQGGVCALCEKPFPSKRGTHVDHCHQTGRIRGILCIGCNHALGKLGDTPASLHRAYVYVLGKE